MNARLNAPTFELHPLCVLFPRMAGMVCGACIALREKAPKWAGRKC